MDKEQLCYEMIRDCLTIIENGEHVPVEKAFEKFIAYCSVHLYLGSDGVELKAKTLYALDQIFNLDVLKEARCDVIGSVYHDIVLLNKKEDCLSKKLDGFYGEPHLLFPQAIFVDDIGTASYFIDKSKNVMVYAVSKNLTNYHISIINRKLYDLPIFNLYIGSKNANTLNLEPSSNNWEFANRWKPVKGCHLT